MSDKRAEQVVRQALAACNIATPDLDEEHDGEIALGDRFADIGFDSLAMMEFSIAIHVETGIAVTTDELDALGTPDAVIRYLEALL